MKRSLLRSLCLLALCLFAGAAACADTLWDDTWGFANRVDAVVTYTEADAARYLNYYEETKHLNVIDMQYTLEDYAAYAAGLIANDTLTVSIYDAYPTGDWLAGDEALCIAYAYVEQTYQVPEAVFLRYEPTVRFRGNVDDPGKRVWVVCLQVPTDCRADPAFAPYLYYFLNIDAETGTVVDCVDCGEPAAG